MVVLAVVALLIAVIVPLTTGIFSQARQTICQNNLHHIGVAFANQAAEAKATNGSPFAPSAWTGALITYVGDNRKTYVCPEDDCLTNPVPALEEYYIYDNSTKFYMPLEGAPLTAKLNQSQYDIFDPLEATKNRVVPPYVNDGTGVWWYCFEDLRTDAGGTAGGGDKDFDDIQVRCTMQPDYRIKVEFKKGGSGHSFSFADPQRNVVAGYGLLNNTNPPFYIGGGGTACSYGVNGYAMSISAGQKVIFAMDYESAVVNNGSPVVGGKIDDWSDRPHGDGKNLTFARHRGRVNTVWADGSVATANPLDIDIRMSSLRSQYWIPR
jgi:prepilin-type processing-associated H-X9-DG protein